jgi:D-inositol-3-phosphate glycosyltransferase
MRTALLVAHHYPPHIGGLGGVVEKQALGMAENGFHVVVLTSRFGRSGERNALSGIEVIRLPCSHVLERVFGVVFPLFSPRLLWEAWKQVRRANVVHIHDVFYMSSWVGGVLAVLARKPMLLTQHVGMVDHSSRLVMAIQRFVYATMGHWLFFRARTIIVYNRNVHAFLRSRGVPESKILWLGNGIDTGEFHPATPEERTELRKRLGLPQDRPLVLFLGRLVEKKGYQILLGARDPAYDLVFAGPGHVPEEHYGRNVHWIGPVDQAQASELYRACDLFAFPAVGEIFTLVMQEAMACGLPVITTDDPQYRGSMVSGAVVLCRRDSESFRAAIMRLLADTDGLLKLGAVSRQLAVRHFDWRVNIVSLIDAYSHALFPEP